MNQLELPLTREEAARMRAEIAVLLGDPPAEYGQVVLLEEGAE